MVVCLIKSKEGNRDNSKEAFYDRADEHINLSNTQSHTEPMRNVSASMLYGTARYNAFVFASNYENKNDIREDKASAIEYFVGQYKKMLEENMDDYVENFHSYIKSQSK